MRLTFIALLAILIVSCEKEKPNYPDEPQIQIMSVNFDKGVDWFNNEVIKIEVDFKITDGDSNFGMTEVYPFKEDSVNCNLIIYHNTGDKLIEIYNELLFIKDCDILGCSGYDYPITTKSYTAYEINSTFYFEFPIQKWLYEDEQLKFTVQIWDRDKNMSNVSEFETVCTFE